MFEEMPNSKTVTVKITRFELVELMMACTLIQCDSDTESSKQYWGGLHDKLEKQLKDFDTKIGVRSEGE